MSKKKKVSVINNLIKCKTLCSKKYSKYYEGIYLCQNKSYLILNIKYIIKHSFICVDKMTNNLKCWLIKHENLTQKQVLGRNHMPLPNFLQLILKTFLLIPYFSLSFKYFHSQILTLIRKNIFRGRPSYIHNIKLFWFFVKKIKLFFIWPICTCTKLMKK